MAVTNIGTLARVDAAKTNFAQRTLREFSLFTFTSVGRAGKSPTRTGAIAWERPRGVPFRLGRHKVNLTDIPGHSDVIAEAEWLPRVRGGTVPDAPAIAGLPPPTCRLARAIRAANLPALIFLNSQIVRLAADGETRSFPCLLFGL